MATYKNAPAPPDPNAPMPDCPETQKVFDDFQIKLDGDPATGATGEKDDAQKIIDAKKTAFDGALSAVCIERKAFKKVQEAQNFYTLILNCQAIETCKDIEQAQETVKDQTALAADVKKSFDAVLADMKTLKSKLDDVHLKTDAFRTLVKNSCNTDDKKKATGIDPALLSDANLTAWVDESVSAQDAIDQACETAVQVAGIFGFTNVAALKGYADGAKAQCDAFKSDVEGNLKGGEANLKNGQKSLAEALANLSAAEAKWRMAETVDNALLDTATNTHWPLDTSGLPTIEDIQLAVKKAVTTP